MPNPRRPRRTRTAVAFTFVLVALFIGGLELLSEWQKPRGPVWVWPIAPIFSGAVTLTTYGSSLQTSRPGATMSEPDPLWWRLYRSKVAAAIALAIFLAVLFGWPSVHYGSSLLDRLPSWGWMIPVGLWVAVAGMLWWKHRRDDESAA